jgi:Ca2+-binding RTX toxin-like protein
VSADGNDSTGPTLARFRFADGNVAITRVEFSTGAVAGTPAVTLDWDNADQAVLINRAGYAALPALTIEAFTGSVLDIRGWADVTILRDRPGDQFIVLDAARTGTIATSRGDDVVVVGFAGGAPADADFLVSTGAGSDVVFMVGTVERYGLAGGQHLGDRGTTTQLGRGDDFFVGGRALDRVAGGEGDDSLEGFAGADRLAGGRGQDTMTGGAGADVFAYGSAAEGRDVITDFRPGLDVIEVSATGFGGGLVAGADLAAGGQFAANQDGTATAAFGQFVFDRDASLLWWDVDGTGAAEATLLAELGRRGFDAADIVVVA